MAGPSCSKAPLGRAIVPTPRPLLVLLACLLVGAVSAQESAVPCYSDDGRPQRCQPEFVNAAFELDVEATNTCGLYSSTRYCRQTGVTGATRACAYCDASSTRRNHPPKYLTDYHKEMKMTWWQSDTMNEGIQYPNSVNLTISLGKAFDITYVRLKFYSPRPESFAIFKRTLHDGPWIPYQYYSGSCQSTYNVRRSTFAPVDDETMALCTDDFSDISPLTGGNIAFGTLEGRPSAYSFDDSTILQEWVTATDIMVKLTRLNTFGDEVFREPDVLRSYYYAISDFSIGGRCKCNGHASECINGTSGDSSRLVCRCEHFTSGVDCNECLPFYNDQPWKAATSSDVNECQACDCNGRSTTCYFDQDLYERTGHGGNCEDCRGNTAGTNCERCRDNYFQGNRDDACQPCNCDPIGSLSLQCNSDGQCICKIGVGGDKCNQCLPNYYNFGVGGCQSCDCLEAGSQNNEPSCDRSSGRCECKENVEGHTCDRCEQGYFNLKEDDPFGCMACFCHGHSTECSSAPGYEYSELQSTFSTDSEGWTARGRYGEEGIIVFNPVQRDIGVASENNRPIYFIAPDEYLGNKRLSYGQDLTFNFRHIGGEPSLTVEDLILMGSGLTISAPLVAQDNPSPGPIPQQYTFKLREEDSLGWVQRPSAFDFQRLLSNLTAIMVRATYSDGGRGIIDNFDLPTVRRAVGPGAERVDFVELCQCPEGYIGQFCESCDGKYRRDPPGGGPYAQCIPCECNGHANYCEESSGICICRHNTVGDQCQECAPGYYGNAREGNEDDCTPCPCPGGSECMHMPSTGEVMCTNCPMGYVGNLCEFCADGFFGDPEGDFSGTPTPCVPCECSGNIDGNAIRNCDRNTGECLKCIYNTGGFNCESCLPGFYGNALGLPKGQCRPCDCNPGGSFGIECDQTTGACQCLPFVEGRQCDECQLGYWDIDSGKGCQPCHCDGTGTTNMQCDLNSGQCDCKEGVGGQLCDQCQFDHYGFSSAGCQSCRCDPQGSAQQNCSGDGVCDCKDGVIGEKCDTCEENHYNIALGCVPCPACYNLVQDKVNDHREKLKQLEDLINNVGANPDIVNDAEFEKRLQELEESLDITKIDAEEAVDTNDLLATQFGDLTDNIDNLKEQLGGIRMMIGMAADDADTSMNEVADTFVIINRVKKALADAQQYLDNGGWKVLQQLNDTARNMSEQALEMQQLAKKARELATGQEVEAGDIEGVAMEAKDTSEEALRLVQGTGSDSSIEDEINKVESDYNDAQGLFEMAAQLAQDSKAQADIVNDEATSLLAKSKQPLPSYDGQSLKDDAEFIKEEAERIKAEAGQVKAENQDLLAQVKQQAQEAQGMLDRGNEAQQKLDLLMAEAHGAETDAQAAKSQGEETLNEANDILDDLLGFNEKVETSQAEAADALLRIPEIERKIDQANQTSMTAQQTIDTAKDVALKAREVAGQAEANATTASEGAEMVKEAADDIKAVAQAQNDRGEMLKNNASQTMMELGALETQADDDSGLIQEAQVKANEAKRKTDDATAAVQGALDDVNRLMDDLEGLGSLDPDHLLDIEDNLNNVKRTYERDLNIDQIMQDLAEAEKEQLGWIDTYQFSLDELRAQVENIQQISDSLPNFCPNFDILENNGRR